MVVDNGFRGILDVLVLWLAAPRPWLEYMAGDVDGGAQNRRRRHGAPHLVRDRLAAFERCGLLQAFYDLLGKTQVAVPQTL